MRVYALNHKMQITYTFSKNFYGIIFVCLIYREQYYVNDVYINKSFSVNVNLMKNEKVINRSSDMRALEKLNKL